MPDATLDASYPAYRSVAVGRIRRLRRIRQYKSTETAAMFTSPPIRPHFSGGLFIMPVTVFPSTT
ncbi:hypothetical protein DMI65_05340 [Escherichia coli]|nr:hypothetical protein [Escherichia coli]